MAHVPATVPSPADTNRRRDLRLQILGQLYGHIVALDVPLAVQNLSAGGFAIDSPIPFHAGTEHKFRFTTEKGQSITVSAQVVHSMRCASSGSEARYLVGCEFVRASDDDGSKEAIDALLDTALSGLTFH